MSHKAAKLGLTGLVIALAFGGLLYTSLGESAEYYKHVDEVMVSPQQWQGKKLQLHGYAKDVSRKRDSLDYKFTVENNGKSVVAYYSGVVPDTFKNDAEVVVKGTLAADGTFHVQPDGVIAKCPSKYDAKSAPTRPAGAE
jgi:cytochrome c-type biogenesis protein CcmE